MKIQDSPYSKLPDIVLELQNTFIDFDNDPQYKLKWFEQEIYEKVLNLCYIILKEQPRLEKDFYDEDSNTYKSLILELLERR